MMGAEYLGLDEKESNMLRMLLSEALERVLRAKNLLEYESLLEGNLKQLRFVSGHAIQANNPELLKGLHALYDLLAKILDGASAATRNPFYSSYARALHLHILELEEGAHELLLPTQNLDV